jgi:F-type H+-transporting ATPase subunit epsilon
MFRVNIVSSDQVQFFEANEVILPLVDGYMGVLSRHSPFAASLDVGLVTVKTTDGMEKNYAIAGGVASFASGFLRIITPALYETDDINAFIKQLDEEYKKAHEASNRYRSIQLNP